MGSTISYSNNGFERSRSIKAKKQRRRDSMNRPVLKLHISSNSMERQHKMNGQTSLDHPFLKRLSSHKYESVDPLRDSRSVHHSIQAMDSDLSLPEVPSHSHNSSGSIRTSTLITTVAKGTLPHSASMDHNPPPSPSFVTVKFINNGESAASLLDDGTTFAAENNRLRLIKQGQTDDPIKTKCATSAVSSPSDSVATNRISSPKQVKDFYLTEQLSSRSQSMDDLSKPKVYRKASVRVSRRITHTTSLHDDLDEINDVEVIFDKEDWSFGENIMKCLEAEGIVLVNIEEPQTSSEREIDAAWPELRQKMSRWRSEQSILDL